MSHVSKHQIVGKKGIFLSAIFIIVGVFVFAASSFATTGLTVGTSSLSLNAADNILYGVTSATNATGSFLLFEKGVGNGVFKIDYLGSVGIGTTDPGTKLDLPTGALRALSATVTGLGSSGNVVVMADNTGSLFSTTTASFFSTNSLWGGTKNSDIWNGDAGVGRVGIGTTTPGYKLEVNGEVALASGNWFRVRDGGGTGRGVISIDSSSSDTLLNIPADTSKNFRFVVGGSLLSEVMRVTGTGSVGIGTTNPSLRTHIQSTSYGDPTNSGLTPNGALAISNTADASVLYVGSQGASPFGQWLQVSNSTDLSAHYPLLLNPNGGDVGIGTTAPANKLAVSVTGGGGSIIAAYTNSAIRIIDTNSGANSKQGISWARGDVLTTTIAAVEPVVEAGWDTALDFYSGNASGPVFGMRIDKSGNLGIGTTDPGTKLDVVGTFRNSLATTHSLLGGNGNAVVMADNAGALYAASSTPGLWNGTLNDNIWNGDAGAGNVGIGTTAPVSKLHIKGDAGSHLSTQNVMILFEDSAQVNGRKARIWDSLNTTYWTHNLYMDSSAAWNLDEGGTYGGVALSLNNANGLVLKAAPAGVNPVTPVNQFTVSASGQGYFAGSVTVAGGLTVSATSTLNGNIQFGGQAITALNMNGNDLTGVDKLTVATIDPLYRIGGVNYSTYASSLAGGVKEEYVGKAKLNEAREYILDFDKIKTGSDLWVWRQAIDFSRENVDALVTPYGAAASIYYVVQGNKIIFHGDKPAEFSFRLVGKRFDWRNWPTYAEDQRESAAGLIIK